MTDTIWQARTDPVPNGQCVRLLENRVAMSFDRYFTLLENNDDFAAWYTALLAGSDYDALFWEHPPLTETCIGNDTEFVLIDAPSLAARNPDPSAFRSHFARQDKTDVIAFPNLGHDAMMVAPCPARPQACAHLAAFLRHGPPDQVRELWRQTANAVRESVGSLPMWLSTSGLGVSWLHIRLDSFPKYYQHKPYKSAR